MIFDFSVLGFYPNPELWSARFRDFLFSGVRVSEKYGFAHSYISRFLFLIVVSHRLLDSRTLGVCDLEVC